MPKRTRELTLLSSDHGRMRREQRGLEKIDLQTAIKYGKKQSSQHGNWMFTFGDTVVITDHTCTKEITSWQLPNTDLEHALIGQAAYLDHTAVKAILLEEPTKCTAHTVVVIDQSGSMRKCDVDGYKRRTDAAFAALATDYVATTLRCSFSSNSEVVSVITMSGSGGTAQLVREPISWVLYNQILELKNTSRPQLQGKFLPALDEAKRLLSEGLHDNLALHLIFLSDERPSDNAKKLPSFIADMARTFRGRISFKFIGFGAILEELSALPKMAAAVKAEGVEAEFVHSKLQSQTLSTAMRSSTVSINKTICDLTVTSGRGKAATKAFTKEGPEMSALSLATPLPGYWNKYAESEHYVWDPENGEFRKPTKGPPIAVSKLALGNGAERIVYRLRQLDDGVGSTFVGPLLVAKDSLLEDDLRDEIHFHETFCATQFTSSRLAKEFNQALQKLPNFNPYQTPQIEFLECGVYVVRLPTGIDHGYLVEEMLDVKQYRKWNDNAGGVDGYVLRRGVNLHRPGDVPAAAAPERLAPVLEGDDEEASDDDDDDDDDEEGMVLDPYEMGNKPLLGTTAAQPSQEEEESCGYCGSKDIRLNDFPQAFSHFTRRYTRGKLIVCDLQVGSSCSIS